MKSEALTVEDYLNSLPADRQDALRRVRDVILNNLPKGYVETMRYGMISYEVPLAIEPKTYNGQPLNYAGLASQKNHMAIYLCGLYCVPGNEEVFRKSWAGGKLDMGKSCVRFKALANLDLDLIGKAIASMTVAEFVKASKR